MGLSDGIWRIGRVLILGVLLTGAADVVAASADKADVRVLIDISGSMRQNDPNNLRRPALRMLAGLLQPGTRAGVWTFARWVNNLVPVADVDAAWKTRIQSISKQIASPGQFTNIEEVLDKASRDWSGNDATYARHLVLLTDGMVDISKQAGDNEASRMRILDGLLPRLKADGVKVHTIALSERADHELMKRLAGETGGWYEQVEQADQLQRVFLRMFETVGAPDTVPLKENRFTVDGAISEATVLVFSKSDTVPVSLRSPSGEVFKDSDLPSGVAWYRDKGYNLITLSSPQKGEWQLEADLDPDNRVMVVTALKLQTSEVPSHIATGEMARIEANLSNRGELVTRKAFLRLLEARAQTKHGETETPQVLNDLGEGDDEAAGDGRYTMRYGEDMPVDEVELLIAFESPTFMREKRFRMVVHEPADAVVEAVDDGLMLKVQAQSAVMQPGASVTAWQPDAKGQRLPLEIKTATEGEWSALLVDATAPTFLTLSGTTRLGNLIEHQLGPLMPPGVEPPPAPVAPEPEPVVTPVEPEVVAPPEPEPVPPESEAPAETEAPEEAEVAEEPAEDWVMPMILFGVFNLVLAIGGGIWYFLRRRRGGGGDELDTLTDDGEAKDEPGKEAKEDAA